MIITAVESPAFSLGRLMAAAEARGVRTRMVTRDADVHGAAPDTAPGEDLVVTLVNSSELDASHDPDRWARSALTAVLRSIGFQRGVDVAHRDGVLRHAYQPHAISFRRSPRWRAVQRSWISKISVLMRTLDLRWYVRLRVSNPDGRNGRGDRAFGVGRQRMQFA